jgi:putative chitinase
MKNLEHFSIFESSSTNVSDFIDYIEKKKSELSSKGLSKKPKEIILDLLLKGVKAGTQAGEIDDLSTSGSLSPEAEILRLQTSVSPVVGRVNIRNLRQGKKENAKLILDSLNKFGIVNPLIQKAILSVIGKESNYIPKNERSYKNTSNGRIRKIFGSRVSDLSDSELTRLKRDEDAFWDRVYGGRYGNSKPGDGSKYRGRGFNQLTFKGNYEKYNRLLKKNGVNVDIVRSPEMVNDPKIAADVNALYFLDRLSSKHSKRKFGNNDPNDFSKFEDALGAAVNANAGWGKETRGSRHYRNALAYAGGIDIEDLSSVA